MDKQCGNQRCRKVKSLDQFGNDKRQKDGKNRWCRDCIREASRRRYWANLEKERAGRREAAKKHYWSDPERFRTEGRERARQRIRDDRAEAVRVYGGRCAACGSDDRLQLDHVSGGGSEHRAIEHHQALYRRIAQRGRPIEDYELQLLCHSHHRAKSVDEYLTKYPSIRPLLKEARLMNTMVREFNTELIQLKVPASLMERLQGEARALDMPFRTYVRAVLAEPREVAPAGGEHLR